MMSGVCEVEEESLFGQSDASAEAEDDGGHDGAADAQGGQDHQGCANKIDVIGDTDPHPPRNPNNDIHNERIVQRKTHYVDKA